MWGYVDEFYSWWYYEGVLKKFDVASIEVPLAVLKRHLTRRFEDIRTIHPRKFERLCQDIFREHLSCDVELTAYSKDGGIDLYTVDGETKYVIQLKRRARKGGEGVAAVRAFLGAMVLDGVLDGIFCTTASHFTVAAKEAAGSPFLRMFGSTLQLVDYTCLLKMFELATGELKKPWENLIQLHRS